MRAESSDRWSEAGIAHLLLIVVIVAAAALAIVAVRNSADNSNATPDSSIAPAMPPADVDAVARTVGPAVVDLDVTLADGGHASATGMVLTPAGEVVTNQHSIADASAITARVAGSERAYVATVLGYDVTDDVAVVGLTHASGLTTIDPGTDAALVRGGRVVVIGSVAGVEGVPTPLTGVVTAVNQRVGAGSKTLAGMVALDVATRASDSGGPITDANGKVLAMTTAAPGGARFREQTTQAATFGIPIDDVLSVVDRVDAGQSTSTVHVGPSAALGMAVRETSPNGGAGAYVVSVQRDGPAARVGIAVDTIVVSIGDTTIPTAAAFATTLGRYHPGDVVRVGWIDGDGVFHAQDVALGTGPPA